MGGIFMTGGMSRGRDGFPGGAGLHSSCGFLARDFLARDLLPRGALPRGSLIAGLPRMLLALVLPPRCKKCGVPVAADDALCATCWSALDFLGPPWCARCGRPFECDIGGEALCGACIAAAPPFAAARAAFTYAEESRELVLRFKHGGDESLARLLARWMAAAGRELFAAQPLLVPVPLHPLRLLRRRFNQSALLSRELSRLTGLDHDPLSLVRIRRTESQGGFGKAARRENVRAAFAVSGKRAGRLAGRPLLLVDDVWTSGATAEACIRACRKAGSGPVSLLTAARVI